MRRFSTLASGVWGALTPRKRDLQSDSAQVPPSATPTTVRPAPAEPDAHTDSDEEGDSFYAQSEDSSISGQGDTGLFQQLHQVSPSASPTARVTEWQDQQLSMPPESPLADSHSVISSSTQKRKYQVDSDDDERFESPSASAAGEGRDDDSPKRYDMSVKSVRAGRISTSRKRRRSQEPTPSSAVSGLTRVHFDTSEPIVLPETLNTPQPTNDVLTTSWWSRPTKLHKVLGAIFGTTPSPAITTNPPPPPTDTPLKPTPRHHHYRPGLPTAAALATQHDTTIHVTRNYTPPTRTQHAAIRADRHAHLARLAHRGWPAGDLTLYSHLLLRGLEPLLPLPWRPHLDPLPAALFTPDPAAAPLRALSNDGSPFAAHHATRALDALFPLGARVRANRACGRPAEPLVAAALRAYRRWSLRDAGVLARADAAVLPGNLLVMVARPEEALAAVTARVARRFEARETRWLRALRTADRARVPCLYGLLVVGTGVAVMGWDARGARGAAGGEDQRIRHMMMCSWEDRGYDHWNAFAVALVAGHARDLLVEVLLEDVFLPAEGTARGVFWREAVGEGAGVLGKRKREEDVDE